MRRYTIFVKNIPLHKLVHCEIWLWFQQFGAITQLVLDERKLACTVHFKETASAAAAASHTQPAMQEPKVEIIYNVGGVP